MMRVALLALTFLACEPMPLSLDAGTDPADAAPPAEDDAGVTEPDAGEEPSGPPGRWTWEAIAGDVSADGNVLRADDLRFRCGWYGGDSPFPMEDETFALRATFFVELDGAIVTTAPFEVSPVACSGHGAPTLSYTTSVLDGRCPRWRIDTVRVDLETGAEDLPGTTHAAFPGIDCD